MDSEHNHKLTAGCQLRTNYEGKSISKKDMHQVQDCAPQGSGSDSMLQPKA